MVQCMEAWFITDRLACKFFGQVLTRTNFPTSAFDESIQKPGTVNRSQCDEIAEGQKVKAPLLQFARQD